MYGHKIFILSACLLLHIKHSVVILITCATGAFIRHWPLPSQSGQPKVYNRLNTQTLFPYEILILVVGQVLMRERSHPKTLQGKVQIGY